MSDPACGQMAPERAALPAEAGQDDAPVSLPTLQRNALCKLLERRDFSPEEVAALGYRRLRMASGIGQKGIGIIVRWLAAHHIHIAPGNQAAPSRRSQQLERAAALLRQHGFVVRPPAEGGRDEVNAAAYSSKE